MDPWQFLYNQALFLLSNLTWLNVIDLILVTAAFYFLLALVRRSPAYLLRETMVLGVILLVVTIVLPLPAFDWLAQGILVAILVATPIIFQTQLRRFLERFGRTIGLAQAVREGSAGQFVPEIIHAVENMSASKTGALIVLEGNEPLDEVIKSGVRCNADVTSELLQTIFYSGTPLHDGAIIIRVDRIVAAGCVLPLTQQQFLQADKRLGTRHRAAVGMSESYDALIIVVSEETGLISAARRGQLKRPMNKAKLREELLDLYDPSTYASSSLSLWGLLKQGSRKAWRSITQASFNEVLVNTALFLTALSLAMVVWSFAFEQTQNVLRARVEDIPLRIENLPADAQLVSPPPEVVSAIVQTTEDVLPTLSPGSFQAVVSFQQSSPGVYRLPVRVSSSVQQALVLSAEPQTLDLELAPIITRTLPVEVNLVDQAELAAAYEVVDVPNTIPSQVEITGPANVVEQVSHLQTEVSLAGVTASLREPHLVQPVDEQGRVVEDLTLQPNQVQVSVLVRRKANARSVSVRPVTSGTPPPGYWLSGLSVTPASVTVQGAPEQLSELTSFVDTLPVDISQAVDTLTVQVPLDLPADVQAVDSEGRAINAVTVVANVAPRSGDLAVTRPVELLKSSQNITVTVTPNVVDLLLSGPLPVLNEIENDPDLVTVSVDVTDLGRDQSTEVTPVVVAPTGVQAQLVPSSVLVTIE